MSVMKTMHIVSSESMTRYCHGEEVVVLPSLLLPYGLLFRDFSEREILRYADDVLLKLPLTNPYPFAVSLLSLLKYDFTKYDKIVVWHDETMNDRLFFYLVCRIVKSPICEIIIDNQNRQKYYDEDYLKNQLKISQPIPPKTQLGNSKEWDRLGASNYDLRILRDNTIACVNIDYFDEVILKKSKTGKLCYSELIENAANVSILSYSLDISSYSFVENRIIYLADEGKLLPFIKESGHWKKSTLKDILPIRDPDEIKFKLSSDITFTNDKKTLYLFPKSLPKYIEEKVNGNDVIVSFPSFVLPYCNLPQEVELGQWKRYGRDVEKLLKITNIEKNLESFFKTNFTDYDRIVVVHTDSVSERLFLYLVNSFIKTDLYELNITNCYKDGSINSIDCVVPKNFDNLFLPDAPKLIPPEDRDKMAILWNQIIYKPSELRVFDSNKQVTTVEIDFLDEFMMEYCTSKYENLICQASHFASSKPFGLNFWSLNRFSLVRLIDLAKNGKVFPYNVKTKEEISVDALEPIDFSYYKKILLLRNRLPKTPSLFD